ncbi:MAG: hypothetical protein IH851_03905 [Armatimonadetes bacterium]|nr:hypothetical protein [Armatimonadota bacterium]
MSMLLCLAIITPLHCIAPEPIQGPASPAPVALSSQGQNGFEDYARAAEWLLDAGPEFDKLIGEAYYPSGRSFLEAQRELVSRYGQALEWVRNGNAKQASYPEGRPSLDQAKATGFSRIAKLFNAEAYVHFADGKTSAGLQSLLNALQFSEGVEVGPTSFSFFAHGSRGIFFSLLNDHLPELSLDNAAKVESFADRILDQTPGIETTLSYTHTAILNIVEEAFRAAAGAAAAPDRIAPMVGLIRGHSVGQREALKQDVIRTLNDHFRQIRSNLRDANVSWLVPEETPGTGAARELLDMIESTSGIIWRGFRRVHLQDRTRYRLLRLHGKIIQYRWTHNRVPATLADLSDARIIQDPLSRTRFEYKPLSPTTFELFSRGSPDTGPVFLSLRGRVAPPP